jgi:proline iminopeptidase
MHVAVNGTTLWFDVEGPALEPEGSGMRGRPTVILVHGGPGSYDHSYFKPHFSRLAATAQVVYLDLRDHGRSARHDPADWSFEACADDLRAFIDALGIDHPVVFGHSMGGMVAILYGARHPGHAGGLILQSTMGRFDLDRLTDGFRRMGGDDVGELAHRSYGVGEVSPSEWARVFRTFGPRVPTAEELARRLGNPGISSRGLELLHGFDVLDQLAEITSVTLVRVGSRDPVTPVAAAEEIVAGLAPTVGRLEIIEGAGHFAWLDTPDRFWPAVERFVSDRA